MNNELIIPIIKLDPTPIKPLLIFPLELPSSAESASAGTLVTTAFTTTVFEAGTTASTTVATPFTIVGVDVVKLGTSEVEET